MSDWLDRLECDAPNLVGSFRALDDGRFIALRREVRRLAGAGSAVRLAREHAAVVAHLDGLIAAASPEVLAAPGGEEDWNVAQALGHATAARQGLVLAAPMAAPGRWPAEAPTLVAGGPPPDPPRPRRVRGLPLAAPRRRAGVPAHPPRPRPHLHGPLAVRHGRPARRRARAARGPAGGGRGDRPGPGRHRGLLRPRPGQRLLRRGPRCDRPGRDLRPARASGCRSSPLARTRCLPLGVERGGGPAGGLAELPGVDGAGPPLPPAA